jgi:hypothetical protein
MPVAAVTAGRRMAQNRISSKEDSGRDVREFQYKNSGHSNNSSLPNHVKGSNNSLGESGARGSKPPLHPCRLQHTHTAMLRSSPILAEKESSVAHTASVRVGSCPQLCMSAVVPPSKRLRHLTCHQCAHTTTTCRMAGRWGMRY